MLNGPRSHLGPLLFWSRRNLVPEKFGTQEIFDPREKNFMRGPNFLGTKFPPKKSEPRSMCELHYGNLPHYTYTVMDPITKMEVAHNMEQGPK